VVSRQGRAASKAKALLAPELATSYERRSRTTTEHGGEDVDVGYRDPPGSAGAMRDGRVRRCRSHSERPLAKALATLPIV
jgi:hypothetical protein